MLCAALSFALTTASLSLDERSSLPALSILDFGGKADGVFNNQQAIGKAMAACAKLGGCSLTFPLPTAAHADADAGSAGTGTGAGRLPPPTDVCRAGTVPSLRPERARCVPYVGDQPDLGAADGHPCRCPAARHRRLGEQLRRIRRDRKLRRVRVGHHGCKASFPPDPPPESHLA